MASGLPLFDGDSDIDQLHKIFRLVFTCSVFITNHRQFIRTVFQINCVCFFLLHFSVLGTPNEGNWPGITKLRNYTNFYPNIEASCLHKKCLIRGAGYDLLKMMLVMNPVKRTSAKKILIHPYFNGFDHTKRFPPVFINPNNTSL